jgi:SAM-dependent methyltransferase
MAQPLGRAGVRVGAHGYSRVIATALGSTVTRRRFVTRLRLLVPTPAKPVVRQLYCSVDPLLLRRYRARTGEQRPIPPARLRLRIGAPRIASFFELAHRSVAELEAGLAEAGRSLADVRSVLDFGCGCARMLQELEARHDGRLDLHGCDIDHEAIHWASSHFPSLRLDANGFRPPLPYRDGAFDLVYASSVFTHLHESAQDDWLAELARVLSPRGVALLSVLGTHGYEEYRSATSGGNSREFQRRLAGHDSLDHEGFVYEPYERTRWNEREFVGIDETYGLAFHSEEYVRRHWSEWFDVLAILPRGWVSSQDLVVVANREVGA